MDEPIRRDQPSDLRRRPDVPARGMRPGQVALLIAAAVLVAGAAASLAGSSLLLAGILAVAAVAVSTAALRGVDRRAARFLERQPAGLQVGIPLAVLAVAFAALIAIGIIVTEG